MMLSFELLHIPEGTVQFQVARARIPGGWLVCVSHTTSAEGGCCFVPDPGHEWDGTSAAAGIGHETAR